MKFNLVGFNFFKSKAEINVGDEVTLVKEPDNDADNEAIKVIKNYEQIAYVANSTNTVSNGCYSAGRLYDKIEDGTKAKIIIVDHKKEIIIGEVEEGK